MLRNASCGKFASMAGDSPVQSLDAEAVTGGHNHALDLSADAVDAERKLRKCHPRRLRVQADLRTGPLTGLPTAKGNL